MWTSTPGHMQHPARDRHTDKQLCFTHSKTRSCRSSLRASLKETATSKLCAACDPLRARRGVSAEGGAIISPRQCPPKVSGQGSQSPLCFSSCGARLPEDRPASWREVPPGRGSLVLPTYRRGREIPRPERNSRLPNMQAQVFGKSAGLPLPLPVGGGLPVHSHRPVPHAGPGPGTGQLCALLVMRHMPAHTPWGEMPVLTLTATSIPHSLS